HSSPDAQYRASKLKYFLYRRALGQVFDYVRDYSKRNGRQVACYVATHSLLNYAQWKIVSPMSSLIGVGADGYIAQVWTGTARTPNMMDGVRKERTFETAFLEYGAMKSIVRATGKKVWFLHDPIEDRPDYCWEDYRGNWESTVVASLLHPEVWRYEVMPWPDRIFTRDYPVRNLRDLPPGTQVPRIGIPDWYETELQAVIRVLGDMKQDHVSWISGGTPGIGILVSDTMMFQRAGPQPSDGALGSFYGLALPLLSRGVPVEPVQLEHVEQPGFLDPYRVLLLTYEGQKPPSAKLHVALAEWVKRGGTLVVVDDDGDPYNAVREWWNTAPMRYATPRLHLFEQLGVPAGMPGVHGSGKGFVVYEKLSPAALTREAFGGERVRGIVRRALNAAGIPWREAAALALRRGPYVIASGLENPGATPVVLPGRYVDLFDARLPILEQPRIEAGRHMLLVDLDTAQPGVAAAACRVREERRSGNAIAFRAEGIAGTRAAVRVKTAQKPAAVLINGRPLPGWRYEEGTVWLTFANSPDGVEIAIR
ncbi:MAG: DUF4350 domain-containing protein, partial [Acidobacteria bacterium]|nr:DUF4350 domain-containing protein [Acidobacteriota bacterium]